MTNHHVDLRKRPLPCDVCFVQIDNCSVARQARLNELTSQIRLQQSQAGASQGAGADGKYVMDAALQGELKQVPPPPHPSPLQSFVIYQAAPVALAFGEMLTPFASEQEVRVQKFGVRTKEKK